MLAYLISQAGTVANIAFLGAERYVLHDSVELIGDKACVLTRFLTRSLLKDEAIELNESNKEDLNVELTLLGLRCDQLLVGSLVTVPTMFLCTMTSNCTDP